MKTTNSTSHHIVNMISAIRSKVYLNIIIIALLTLVFPASSPAQKAHTTTKIAKQLDAGNKTVRIVCFGDSITGVYYHSGSARAWTDMLGITLKQLYPKAKLEMINAGISGHTTVNALARIKKDVIEKKPDLVVIMFGMNDVARVKIDDYEKNLRNIARQCIDAGAAVILCTPNSVYKNPKHSNKKLNAYSECVRTVAHDSKLPLVDFFKDWSELHQNDETAWMLIMSETIHPNMNGHKRFARLITQSLSQKKFEAISIPPAPDPLLNTLKLLRANQPVKLVAMPPYDKLIPKALKKEFPHAKIEVTPWPVKDQKLSEIRKWSLKIRKMSPNLVVINVPPTALTQPSDTGFIRDYQWILNNSFHFSKRQWDVLSFLPTNAALPDNRLHLARRITFGKDIAPLSSLSTDLITK